jgi:hypothetical protein
MPTFHDITKDAEESYQAMRALAHQTITVKDPAELYWLLGTLNATVRSLQQVLHQVGNAHRAHADIAFTDDGDHGQGSADAINACRAIRRAGDLLEGVQNYIDEGQSASGRIAWRPPAAEAPAPMGVEDAASTSRRRTSDRAHGGPVL